VTRRESNADAQNAAILAAARQVEAANSRAALTVGSSATAVAQHAAAVAETRAAIDGAVIVAPSDGFVGGVNATPGEIAGPGGVRVFAPPQPLPQKEGGGIALFPQPAQQSTQPQSEARSLITLNSGAVKVVAQVSEADLDMVTERREAKITFPALRNRSFSGLVTAIEPQAVNIDDRVYFLVDIALSEVPRASFSLRPVAANDPTVTTPVFGLTANVRF
jgi:multidrug resistance efflux pump